MLQRMHARRPREAGAGSPARSCARLALAYGGARTSRKPVHIPDLVRGRLFRDHALGSPQQFGEGLGGLCDRTAPPCWHSTNRCASAWLEVAASRHPRAVARLARTGNATMSAEAADPRRVAHRLPGATVLQIVPALVDEPGARAAVNIATALLRSGARAMVAGGPGMLVGQL